MSDAQFGEMLIFWSETYTQTIWLAAVMGGVLGSLLVSMAVAGFRLAFERLGGFDRD